MINPMELKIGSTVKSKKFNTEVQLTLADFAEAYAYSKENASPDWFVLNLEPIPLTEKWLKGQGFAKDEQDWFYIKFKVKHTGCASSITTIRINVIQERIIISSTKAVREAWNVEIEYKNYVHQVQNLIDSIMKNNS